jgi:organic radical activating enzyme
LIQIQWSFGNHCNYNCAYCPDVFKSGSIPFPDSDQFVNAFDLIYKTFPKFNLQLLGGEPTAYPGLGLALSTVSKDADKKITLETNGSKELSWWQIHASHFSNVVISLHKKYAGIEHVLKVAEFLRDQQVEVKIKFPIEPTNWNEIIQIRNSFRYSNFNTELQLLYKNFTQGNNQYLEYSQEQLNYYYQDRGIKVEQISNQIEHIRVHKQNKYTGHMCWTGVEQFVIDRQGYVFRGWCEQNGTLGNILQGTVKWSNDPVLCGRTLCVNGFDLQARKSEGSWGNI